MYSTFFFCTYVISYGSPASGEAEAMWAADEAVRVASLLAEIETQYTTGPMPLRSSANLAAHNHQGSFQNLVNQSEVGTETKTNPDPGWEEEELEKDNSGYYHSSLHPPVKVEIREIEMIDIDTEEEACPSSSPSSLKQRSSRSTSNSKGSRCEFSCKLCPRSAATTFRIFGNAEELANHCTSFHPILDDLDHLDKGQSTQSTIPIVSSNPTAYHCLESGKDFKRQDLLRKHTLYYVHQRRGQVEARKKRRSKRVICTVCGRSVLCGALKGHMEIHSTDRPKIYCQICGAGCISKEGFEYHMRKHKGEKPFKCPHCTRTFTSKGNRRNHIMTHEGKPHVCDVCGKSYARPSALKKHKDLEHPIVTGAGLGGPIWVKEGLTDEDGPN